MEKCDIITLHWMLGKVSDVTLHLLCGMKGFAWLPFKNLRLQIGYCTSQPRSNAVGNGKGYSMDSYSLLFSLPSFIQSFHWHVQNAVIPCHSQELLPFFPIIHFSCHSSPPTMFPSSLTLSCHLFLGLPLGLVSKFINNTLLGILFSSILCTCPNQRNLFNLIVSVIVGFLTIA